MARSPSGLFGPGLTTAGRLGSFLRMLGVGRHSGFLRLWVTRVSPNHCMPSRPTAIAYEVLVLFSPTRWRVRSPVMITMVPGSSSPGQSPNLLPANADEDANGAETAARRSERREMFNGMFLKTKGIIDMYSVRFNRRLDEFFN